jgi:hypothetical protein
MNAKTIAAVALAVPLALAPAVPAQARPGEPSQTSYGSCGDGELLGDFFVVERSHRDTLHLHLSGTITRTGHLTGKYAEVQADRFGEGDAASYTGTLSRLVVPTRGAFSLAGRAVVGEDGSFSFTPGLRPLVEDDWVASVCEALA